MADIIGGIGTSSAAATAQNYVERMPVQKMDQDDFIKILVTQLTAQDPLNPQKDTEFVGQMAQFSALESTKSMQSEIQTLRANTLIGQQVEVSTSEATISGEVTGVVHVKGEPKILIGDELYSLSEVIRVERFTAPASVNRPEMARKV